jgi:hypothetical protein
MITKKIQELAATRAKIATLEKAIATQLNRELAALPAKFGFDSAQAFAKAVLAAKGGRGGKKAKVKAAVAAKSSRKPRAVITDATRAQVKKLSEAGKTGEEIAKAVGISLPSVHNIKKALGLVNKR